MKTFCRFDSIQVNSDAKRKEAKQNSKMCRIRPVISATLRHLRADVVLLVMCMSVILSGCSRPVGFEKDQMWVYLPKNYTGKERWGLFVYVSPQGEHEGLPPSWTGVLNAHHLLYVCPQWAGNEVPSSTRRELAESAVFKMNQAYAVDLSRVYVAGLSSGARVACDLGLQRPDIFRGVIAMSGADFYHEVSRKAVTEEDLSAHPEPYGVFAVDPESVRHAKQAVRFVFTTGGNDFRQDFVDDLVNGGYRAEDFQVQLFDRPNAGHGYISGSTLEKALSFLESSLSSKLDDPEVAIPRRSNPK
jgi:hypothetical protein